jgi:hypothetical protein
MINIKTNIFIVCMMLTQIWSVGQSPLSKYVDFTPERQSVLEKMSDFFDKTIRENFPAKADTSSYKAFFHCMLIDQAQFQSMYILQIDRKKLAEINADLFKDENYYFFYTRYLVYQDNGLSDSIRYRIYHDSVPTERAYTPDISRHDNTWWWYSLHLNRDGYIRQVVERNIENPLIREVDYVMRASGDFGFLPFMTSALNINLREMSDPVVKQLAAVALWRHVCFCGGVDLARRKGFCSSCCVD